MPAVLLVVVKFALQFFNLSCLSLSDLRLHVGVVVGLIGSLLAKALG